MLLRVENLLYSIHRKIKAYTTQQEVADAIKILEDAEERISNPDFDITLVQPPTTNLNTKGRKSMRGVKSNTERLKIFREIFEEKQEKIMKKKEKDEQKNEELAKRKRQIEIEERHVELEQKKRKITVLVKDESGSFVNTSQPRFTSPEIKEEASAYDR